MDFGKLPSIRGVKFELAAEDPRSSPILGGILRTGRELRLGLPVWTPKEWVGKLYRRGTAARDFLKQYGAQFGTVELNAVHYAIPDAPTIARWKESVGTDFRFSPKVPQAISHGLGSRVSEELIPAFIDAMRGFGDRLGISFLQLPPQLGPDGLPVLLRAVDRLVAAALPLAIEFRHPKWFDESRQLIAPAFEALRARDVATVITDVAGRRDVCHASLTAPRVLVRFVGNQDEASDYSRATRWAAQIARWYEQGLESAYVFVHQPDNRDVLELAAELNRKFALHASVPLRRQLDLSGGDTQMVLF